MHCQPHRWSLFRRTTTRSVREKTAYLVRRGGVYIDLECLAEYGLSIVLILLVGIGGSCIHLEVIERTDTTRRAKASDEIIK